MSEDVRSIVRRLDKAGDRKVTYLEYVDAIMPSDLLSGVSGPTLLESKTRVASARRTNRALNEQETETADGELTMGDVHASPL